MNDVFKEICDKFETMSNSERLAFAKKAALNLLNYLIRAEDLTKDEAFVFVVAIIRLFVSYDKLVDQKECDLFNELFGTDLSLKELKEICEEEVDKEAIDEIVDMLPDVMKDEVCFLGLAFISSDGKINDKEKEIFAKILR